MKFPIAKFLASLVLLCATMAVAHPMKRKKDKVPTLQEKQEAERYFTEGMKEFLLSNYSKALDNFFKADDLHPNQSGIQYMIAQVHFRNGELSKAETYAIKALNHNETFKHAYLLLTEIYTKEGKFGESTKVYQQMIKKIPKSDGYLYNLAESQIYDRKYDDAVKTLEKIEKLFGKSEEVSKQKQRLFMFQNKTDEAVSEARALVEIYPHETQYKTSLAELLFSLNKKTEAFHLLEEASKEDPNDPYSRLMLYEYYKSRNETKQAFEQLFKAFESPNLSIDNKVSITISFFGEIEKDVSKREYIQKLAQIIVNTHPNDAKSYSIQGDIYLLSEKKQQAIESFKEAVKLDNSKYKIWQKIISMYADMSEIDSMLTYSEQALELFPNQNIFWYYKGTGKYLKKQYTDAAKALEYGKKLSLNDEKMLMQFLSQLGDVYHYTKEYKKSDESFKEVLKRDSNNAHVLNNYSYFLSLRKENLDEAERLGRKLIQLYPDDATYLDTYAWVLYAKKNYVKAEEFLSKAVKLTNNATILEHYGDVLYKNGKINEAVEYWTKAKEAEGEVSEFLHQKITDQKLYE